MSLMTSPAVIRARHLLRKTGLTRVALNFLNTRGYEAIFANSMKAAVQPGWCIWDVGANVGLYSRYFSEWTGFAGKVIAFEPSAQTRGMMGDLPSNVELLPIALGAQSMTAMLDRGAEEDGANARIGEHGTEQIQIVTGDQVIAENPGRLPNMIKIDVEGFELEVLHGMAKLLKNNSLKCVFIEVHFAILGATGRNRTPDEIVELLKSNGFKTSWIDQSHLLAKRV